MKIFASSQIDLADTFLHAGYISAQPLSWDTPAGLVDNPVLGAMWDMAGPLAFVLGAVALGTGLIGVAWLGRHVAPNDRWWGANVWSLATRPLRRPPLIAPPES